MKSTFETTGMTFFSQARRTCGTTHFIRPCTILHATGIGLPPNFEDCTTKFIINPRLAKSDDVMMKIADCCVQKHHKLIQHTSCHIQ